MENLVNKWIRRGDGWRWCHLLPWRQVLNSGLWFPCVCITITHYCCKLTHFTCHVYSFPTVIVSKHRCGFILYWTGLAAAVVSDSVVLVHFVVVVCEHFYNFSTGSIERPRDHLAWPCEERRAAISSVAPNNTLITERSYDTSSELIK